MSAAKFGTAVLCIDGRIHGPVRDWLRARYYLDYVDLVTEAGADAALAGPDSEAVERLRRNVARSVERHGSSVAAIVGHADCAANPVSRESHLAVIRVGLQLIRHWNFAVTVVGLYVTEVGDVEEVV